MRKFVRFVGGLIIIGAFIVGALMWYEAPLPQGLIDVEASLGFTQRGLFISDGYATTNDKTSRGLAYTRYTKSNDTYQWGRDGHYDYLPYNSVIKVGIYIDHRIFACVNGMSVLFDTPDLMRPATAEEIANDPSISQNHVNDTCQLVIGKQYR